MSLHHLQTPLKDPVANPPWFDCGPAAKTGEVYAAAFYGVTILHWGSQLSTRAATVEGHPADGDVVDIEGYRWTVRWSDAEAAERDKQTAEMAPRPSMKAAA